MNLRQTIEIIGGGPGSGCNPRAGKCGRPKSKFEKTMEKYLKKEQRLRKRMEEGYLDSYTYEQKRKQLKQEYEQAQGWTSKQENVSRNVGKKNATVYHGTALESIKSILKNGLKPGNYFGMEGERGMVYVTETFAHAASFAQYDDNGLLTEGIVLKLSIPKSMYQKFKDDENEADANTGSAMYKGKISPKHIVGIAFGSPGNKTSLKKYKWTPFKNPKSLKAEESIVVYAPYLGDIDDVKKFLNRE